MPKVDSRCASKDGILLPTTNVNVPPRLTAEASVIEPNVRAAPTLAAIASFDDSLNICPPNVCLQRQGYFYWTF
jgi:hypothetical protein